MLYESYELQRLALAPMRLFASNALSMLDLPFNPVRQTPLGRVTAAMLDSFEHTTRSFGKPRFGYDSTLIDGAPVAVTEEVVFSRVWGSLKRFRRAVPRPGDP